MLIVKKSLRVVCEVCKKVHDIAPEFECIASNERNMGLETFYESYDEFICSNCGTPLLVSIQICEYPENSLNNIKYDRRNLNILEPIDVDFFEL